jgi:hypothetical protein
MALEREGEPGTSGSHRSWSAVVTRAEWEALHAPTDPLKVWQTEWRPITVAKDAYGRSVLEPTGCTESERAAFETLLGITARTVHDDV